jgi:hypothetical protein
MQNNKRQGLEDFQPPIGEKLKRVSDISPRVIFEGEPIKIENILDEDVKILAFQSRPSQLEGRETYLAIQIEHNGIKKVISTGASAVLDTLEGITQDQLPVIGKFTKGKGKSGRGYYTIT